MNIVYTLVVLSILFALWFLALCWQAARAEAEQQRAAYRDGGYTEAQIDQIFATGSASGTPTPHQNTARPSLNRPGPKPVAILSNAVKP